jgi:hypothetical protein
MRSHSEKIPDPKELEKEIGEFLSKKFGDNVKIVTPMILPQEGAVDKVKSAPPKEKNQF